MNQSFLPSPSLTSNLLILQILSMLKFGWAACRDLLNTHLQMIDSDSCFTDQAPAQLCWSALHLVLCFQQFLKHSISFALPWIWTISLVWNWDSSWKEDWSRRDAKPLTCLLRINKCQSLWIKWRVTIFTDTWIQIQNNNKSTTKTKQQPHNCNPPRG